MREAHASRYVHVFRPIVLLLVAGLVVANELLAPRHAAALDYLAVAAAAVVSMASIVAFRRADPIRVAAASAGADLVLVLAWVTSSQHPAPSAIVVMWPLIVIAYFASPRTALVTTVVASAALWAAAATIDAWTPTGVVPVATYGLLVSGALISFVSAQRRRIEGALAEALARDRVAFVLARRIRLADDPRDAIEQIARVLGDVTGAAHALVALLEVEDDFVADLASWHRRDAPRGEVELDATLRHLVSTGHGVVLEHGSVGLLAPEHAEPRAVAGASGVESSLRELLGTLGAGSGVVVPLPIAGRAVGAVILAGDADHAWSTDALPLLEPLAPQLAAGLAQAVLVRDQRDALESLERVDRLRDRLIANVSHELRTPLTSTMGFVETLLRDDLQFDDGQRRELLEHARDGGLRLLALVEDLLTLGSTRPDSLDLSPHPIRASRLLADALRGIEPPTGRRIRVEQVDDVDLHVDRNRMLQVVCNLVVNAIHHGDGDVRVRCLRASDDHVVIDVLDDGDGVDAERRSELFLPFASFSERSDSTGLGLAICRAIVEAHGGTIDYDRIDDATRFRVRIPAGASGGPGGG